MLAPGDVDLGALDQVLAGVRAAEFGGANRCRGGAQRADITAGLRLGQVHRARPFAADQAWQIACLLFACTVMAERLGRADGKDREQGEGKVGRAEAFENHAGKAAGQPLPAERLRPRNRVPALLDISTIGFGEPGRGGDLAIASNRAGLVADPIEWSPFARGKGADPLNDCLDQIGFDAEIGNSSVDLKREQLIGCGGSERHFRLSIFVARHIWRLRVMRL